MFKQHLPKPVEKRGQPFATVRAIAAEKMMLCAYMAQGFYPTVL